MDIKTKKLKHISSLIGMILTTTIAVTFIVNNGLFYIVATWAPLISYEPWFTLTLNSIGLYLVGFTMYSMLMKRIPNYNNEDEVNELSVPIEKKYSFTELISLIFICLAALYASNFVSVAINALISYLKGTDIVNPLQAIISSSNLIYIFIYVCIVAPVVEELMFRKILLNKLMPFGQKLSIVVSAFAFGLFHGNLYQILYAFVIGIILALVTINSGSIKYAIILHIVINTLGSVVFPYLLLSGNAVAMTIAVLTVFLSILVGTVLYVVKRKTLFSKLAEEIKSEQNEPMKISTSLLSIGMIVFWLTITALVIVRTFFFNF
jgi:membrane protease YdiL (CAAX protease family)